MTTIAELHKEIIRELTALYSPDEARAMSYGLLQHFGKFSRTQLHAFPNTEIAVAVIAAIQAGVKRLIRHEPLQYVVGETVFFGLPVAVDSHVLIPRPETEELVEWIIQDARCKMQDARFEILDLCTGSGCIAVALAKQLPQATLYACDISAGALAVARRNAGRNQAKVHFFEYDLLSADTPEMPGKVDCMVSNPPYVRHSEKASMHPNVLLYEPHQALFVDDSDPLAFYRAIARFAKRHLKDTGAVFVEINEALGRETAAVFVAAGFSAVELRKDINGKDRMLKAH